MEAHAFLTTQNAALSHYGLAYEERFIDVPLTGGMAHAVVSGDGPPVVLFNGLGTPAAMWASLMAQLAGRTIYAVDLPSFGLTSTTPTLAQNMRASAVAFIEQVLDALDLTRPDIIANSLGSNWATWFAIEHPSRLRSLVHVGCPALLLNTSAPLPMRLLATRPLGQLMMRIQPPSPKQVAQLSRMVREDPLPPEIASLLLETEKLPDFEVTFLAMLNHLLSLRGARPQMALSRDCLSQISTPSLMILGRDDPFGGETVGREAVAMMANARLQMVDGGHAPWIHHADQIAPLVLAFLSAQDSTA